MIRRLLRRDAVVRRALVSAYVVPEAVRCVQCGLCTYNCPVGTDVRAHAIIGKPVVDDHCLTCGECVARCPRGALRFESSGLFVPPVGSA